MEADTLKESPSEAVPIQVSLDAKLNSFFARLDAAPAGASQPILKKASDKEYVETVAMFAIRCIHAARHHQLNVDRLLSENKSKIEQQLADAQKDLQTKSSKLNVVHRHLSVRSNSAEFIYELSTFLGTLRSGLDFIAKVAGRYVPGVTAHSIKTLIDMAAEGQPCEVVKVVDAHRAWLSLIRDYRDESVHRLVIHAPATGWMLSDKGKLASAVIPVVVPVATPKLVNDTRRSRMMDEDVPYGLMRRKSHGQVTYSDGSKEVLSHEVLFLPAPGFVAIEAFLKQHVSAYEEFYGAVLDCLDALDFQMCSPPIAKLKPSKK